MVSQEVDDFYPVFSPKRSFIAWKAPQDDKKIQVRGARRKVKSPPRPEATPPQEGKTINPVFPQFTLYNIQYTIK